VIRGYSIPGGWSLESITRHGVDLIDLAFELTDDLRDIVVTLTDRLTNVHGSVQTVGGTADADATVIVFPADSARWTNAGRSPTRMQTARASAQGTYSISGLPPGEYLIAAVAEATVSTWQTPAYLQALSRLATRLRIDDGATIAQDLRRVEVGK
jgi:hypothetical protein